MNNDVKFSVFSDLSNLVMGHAIKQIKKRNIKIENEEKEFTFDALSSGFDRFPSYCDIFQETHSTLLSGNGPLPEASRHFIARMVDTLLHILEV